MEKLLVLAATQFGLFTRLDAHERRVSDHMLQARVRNGSLEQIATNVYRVAGSPNSWHQDVLAACWAGGPRCVASHRTACVLHRFDGFRAGIIEVTVPRPQRFRRTGVVVHQSTDLVPADCMSIGPIPVTTPERTLIDSGIVAGYDRLEEAWDGAERDRLIVTDELERRHTQIRRRGRNGAGPSGVCIDQRLDVNPHSVLERRFLRLLDDAGLPTPVCQYPIKLMSGRTAYLDCALVDLTLGFELDGNHHATPKRRASDNLRSSDLADLGWDIRRFTYDQVMRHGDVVVRKVRAAIATRSKLRRSATETVAEWRNFGGGGLRW